MGSIAPIVGVTCSVDQRDHRVRRAYARAIAAVGAVPVYLPAPDDARDVPDAVAAYRRLCDAIVFTGGDDPRTEAFGEPTDPRVNPLPQERQRFELALLDALAAAPAVPVLGVCLGMQLMALHAGGRLDQWMADTTPTHADHMDDREHEIIPEPGAGSGGAIPRGTVSSWHRQAVHDAGRLRVVARAHDGVVEAIDDPRRAFYLGVQWHPERTADEALGLGLFRLLVHACRRQR